MSFRARGRGRGRGGFGFRPANQVSFEIFPEIEGLGKAEYSIEHIQLIKWSWGLQEFWNSSPYFVEDKSKKDERVQQSYIERYSVRKLRATKVKEQLSDYIELGPGFMPAELVRGGNENRHAAKRVKWNAGSDSQKLDPFERLLQRDQADQEGNDKKENKDEEEDEEINEEDEGEYSDEGDYDQHEYFDDDEDDFNIPENDNDEPYY